MGLSSQTSRCSAGSWHWKQPQSATSCCWSFSLARLPCSGLLQLRKERASQKFSPPESGPKQLPIHRKDDPHQQEQSSPSNLEECQRIHCRLWQVRTKGEKEKKQQIPRSLQQANQHLQLAGRATPKHIRTARTDGGQHTGGGV